MQSTNEIASRLEILCPKLAGLEQTKDEQAAKVKHLEEDLIDGGDAQFLASERSVLQSLTTACDVARNDRTALLAAYETAILAEMSEIILAKLQSGHDEAGVLFDKYIEFRQKHSIYGKTKEGIGADLLSKLKLNYVSGLLIERFQKRFGVRVPELHRNRG